jgi:Transmembrane protein 43
VILSFKNVHITNDENYIYVYPSENVNSLGDLRISFKELELEADDNVSMLARLNGD